ncbi:MAG: histidine kinase [Bacteroidota bacterium]|nr:histidine kinase [Bacteroidota bacterium]
MGFFKNKSQHYPLILGFFFLFISLVSSQNNNQDRLIDSLKKQLSHLEGVEKVKVLSDLCYYTSSNAIDESIKYGNRACNLAYELKDTLLMASCMNDLCLSYYYKGNFDSCIILAEKAYSIRLEKKLWRDAAASLSKVALGYYEKGNYAISLEKNLKAVLLFKKAGAFAEVYKLQNNIGSIYERNNQIDEAMRMRIESAEGALKLKDYEAYVTAKGNYAQNLQGLGKVKEARIILDELIPICKQYCREEYMSQIYQSLGVNERLQGNTKKGLEFYVKAKEIYDRIKSLSGMSIINTNIGLCYVDLKQYNEAEEYLKLGLQQSKEIQSLLWQKKAYLGLYTLEHSRENFKLANNYLELHQQINDSIYNIDTQDKLGKLQTEYDVKQKENTILSQQNTINQTKLEINKRNTYLIIVVSAFVILLLVALFIIQRNNINRKKSEINFQKQIQKERSRISKDLHDNMGAELTIISSAIDIKTHSIEKIKDKEDFEKISNQVRKATALMRDTIWTVSEEKISIAQFGIKIREFAIRTFENKNITIHFNNTTSQLNLSPESTLNLYRIAQEAINNTAKHANAKNFYIENFNDDRHIILILKDDGIGYDFTSVEKGYGLNNMINRAKDISAKIDFERLENKYTQIKITLDKTSLWS